MKFYVTGDTHGDFTRMKYSEWTEDDALIILGDAGFNYNLDKNDYYRQKAVHDKYPCYIYCVYGNHEQRPSKVEGLKMIDDPNVGGPVWIHPDFPRIRYFCEWGIYQFGELRVLVIGGAYSVDKYYRLQTNKKWFPDEQLKWFEMRACLQNAKNYEFDLVLSHTCPYSWQPTDLFLSFIDQNSVDNTMEKWMDEVASSIRWNVWLFGHYHKDRIELPHVEMFFCETEDLDSIFARWKKYDETKELDWWLPLSPKMEVLK